MLGAWLHVIVNTHASWLHGDRRGFRSRGHRIHSTGDYHAPPPLDEHAGLRDWHETLSPDAVSFEGDLRVRVVHAFVGKLRELRHRAAACSCGDQHLHALVEINLPYEQAKREIGKCKQKASHAVRDRLPGTVWSAGGEFKRVRDQAHWDNVFDYVRRRQEPGTIVWSERCDEDWVADPTIGWWAISAARELVRVTPIS